MRVLQLALCLGLWSLAPGCDAPEAQLAAGPSNDRPILVHGKAPVAPFVATAEKAKPGRVLVYVGATWCEPCRFFHEALLDGKLDELLSGMQVVEYDLDQHKAELNAAGYDSRLIPLFALPNADGTASVHAMSGSIKGPFAVSENLVPRLRALLEGARAH